MCKAIQSNSHLQSNVTSNLMAKGDFVQKARKNNLGAVSISLAEQLPELPGSAVPCPMVILSCHMNLSWGTLSQACSGDFLMHSVTPCCSVVTDSKSDRRCWDPGRTCLKLLSWGRGMAEAGVEPWREGAHVSTLYWTASANKPDEPRFRELFCF